MEKHNRSIAPSQPSKSQSFRKNSPRVTSHTIKSYESGDSISNLTFKTATRDDVGKLESWVHYQLAQVHNTKIALSPDQVLANTFEQISILDSAHNKLASMIGFHCNQKEELVRRIWSSSADLYNRVYSELSVTINDLKFKLMDKTVLVSKLEDLLEVSNMHRPAIVVSTGPDSTSSVGVYEMSLHRQLEEELILKNKELMALQSTITDLSVWFPEFTRYGHSVLKRYLPPVTASSTIAPSESKDDGSSVVQQAGDLDLAQHFLLRDLKRLEEIGIGFQIVDDSDLTVQPPTQSQPPTTSSKRQNSAIRKKKRTVEVNTSSFSAATENEYNLSHDNPSATLAKEKRFFAEGSGGGTPRTPARINTDRHDSFDAPNLAVNSPATQARNTMYLIPPSPKPLSAVSEVSTGDYYQVQAKRLSMGASTTFAEQAISAAEKLQTESDKDRNLRIDYEEKYRRLLLDAQQLESDISALLDGNAREAAMHKKEVATLNAQVSVLSGQLETTSTQVSRMAEKLPLMMFPPIIRRQVNRPQQQQQYFEQSQVDFNPQQQNNLKTFNMIEVEGLIGKCLQSFTVASPADVQSLMGFDPHHHDSYFNLLSGQPILLGPSGGGDGGVNGSSTMAHRLFHYLSRVDGSCVSALEKVGGVTRAVEAAVQEQGERRTKALDSDEEEEDLAPPMSASLQIQCSASLLRMLSELLQLHAQPTQRTQQQLLGSHLLDDASQSVFLETRGSQPLLGDVMRFDVLVACFKAMKNHFSAPIRVSTADPRCENLLLRGGKALLCGFSSFPVQLTPRIIRRIFSKPSGDVLIGGGSSSTGEHDFQSPVWWHFLTQPLLDRVIFEVEMSSLSHGDGSQAPFVNCYDCILLCWKAVFNLHGQLTTILADLYKFLLSVVPQGPASRSFHLLLTHMVSLPHARHNDLDAIALSSSAGQHSAKTAKVASDAPTTPPPVIHLELAAELMSLEARGALNCETFADLLLRSLPACLMINFAHLLPSPPAVGVTTLPHTRQPRVKMEKKEGQEQEVAMAELVAAGQVLTTKLKTILSEHHNGSSKISPNNANRHHDKHIHKAVLYSKHNGSRESYFKQSVLLHQLLYPKDAKPTVSSDPRVAQPSVSTLTQFIDRAQLEDAEMEWYSSTDRLLMHARLCFEEEFVKVLAPSREQISFTVLALKYQVSILHRLLDCKRSVKSRFNRSNFGNITNDFLGAVIEPEGENFTAVTALSRTRPRSLDTFDQFERVESHFVWRVKRRVFQAWARAVSEEYA